MQSLSPDLYADLIALPFAEGGRGPHEYDCVGQAIEIARRRGFTVPDYASTPEALHAALSADKGILGPCERIDAPEPGCVALLRGFDEEEFHLATMTSKTHMVHASSIYSGGAYEPLRQSRWARRVLGFYRLVRA